MAKHIPSEEDDSRPPLRIDRKALEFKAFCLQELEAFVDLHDNATVHIIFSKGGAKVVVGQSQFDAAVLMTALHTAAAHAEELNERTIE